MHLSRAALAFALVVSGCSLLVESDQAVTISSTDPTATLLVDGRSYGPGSRTVKMTRNQSHVVMAMAGSRSGSVHVGYALSSMGILDIIGGFVWLGPFIGLATPGAWQLEREHVCVMLPPEPGAPPPPAAPIVPAALTELSGSFDPD